MATPLFPTTVIGSLPRPAWVKDLILDRKEGRLSEKEAEQWLAHPHPRREVLKECLYVAWPLGGAVLGRCG